MNTHTKVDTGIMTLRRISVLEERLEVIYASLYFSALIIFLATMGALYLVRKDIAKVTSK
jgi:hypothetical protein